MFFYNHAHSIAWPLEAKTKLEKTQFLYDMPRNAEKFIALPGDQSAEIKKTEHKIIQKISLEYGINQYSSILICLNSNFTIYDLSFKNRRLDPPEETSIKLKMLQSSLKPEIGAIIKLFQSNNKIVSTFLGVIPGTYHLTPAEQSPEYEAILITGLAYGHAFQNKYFEIFCENRHHMARKRNEQALSFTLGIKPRNRLHFAVQSTLYINLQQYLTPATRLYINQFKSKDQVMNEILSNNLEEFFATKKTAKYAKIALKMDYKLNNKTTLMFEIGTNMTNKVFADKYIAFSLQKKL